VKQKKYTRETDKLFV